MKEEKTNDTLRERPVQPEVRFATNDDLRKERDDILEKCWQLYDNARYYNECFGIIIKSQKAWFEFEKLLEKYDEVNS